MQKLIDQLNASRTFRKQYRKASKDPQPDTTILTVLDSEGNPKVVRIPKDAGEDEVAELAFQALHGRKPNELEWTLHRAAAKLNARRPDA